jgi:mannitol-1-phosphate 5-dehydrogenase
MRGLVVGAGKIGLGFAGELLERAGFQLSVVVRDEAVAANLRRNRGYRVRLVGRDGRVERKVAVCDVRLSAEGERLAAEVAAADLVAVSVRPENLVDAGSLLAAGLRARSRIRPLNVIAFENAVDAGEVLRDSVAKHLPRGFAIGRHGFSGAVISRAVTHRLGDPRARGPLAFVGDRNDRFHVKRSGLRDPLPLLPGMVPVEDLEPAYNAKLFVFSAGHATAAYLGFIKGYRYVHAAVRDPEIREAVAAVMREGQEGLAARYGHDLAGDEEDIQAILRRFENAALQDPVDRVARDPRRKLGRKERLLGAARLCEAAGVRPASLPLATAAAVCFAATAESAALEAAPSTLEEVCAASANDSFSDSVTSSWRRLSATFSKEAPLLSLRAPGD